MNKSTKEINLPKQQIELEPKQKLSTSAPLAAILMLAAVNFHKWKQQKQNYTLTKKQMLMLDWMKLLMG